MSHSWRDQVLIALSPTHLSMLRLRGWFGKREIVAQHSQPIPSPQPNEAVWQPLITALDVCLQEPKWSGARAQVVISNSLVRCMLLPWSGTLLSPEEEQKFVQFKMEEVFGISVRDWNISLAEENYGNARLVAAIDTELLKQINQLASRSHLRLKSIQPHLVAALNYWRKYLKSGQFYFLMPDGERLCMAFIKQGHMEGLRVEQINGSLTDTTIASALKREILMNHHAVDATDGYLFMPGKTQKSGNTGQSQQFQRLSLPVHYSNDPAAFLAAAYLA